MNLKKPDKGLIGSAVAHAALLLLAFVGFSEARKFDDAQESLSVDMITDTQFAEIMKGEKTAKETKPVVKAAKAAEVPETKPDVPVNPVAKEVPLPPPPLKRLVEEEKPEVMPPPAKAVAAPPKPEAPQPPARPPEPVKAPLPPPPKPAPPPPPKLEAETIAPAPPPRPAPPKQVAELPPPPPRPEPPKLKLPDPPPVPDAVKLPDPPKLVPEKAKAAEPPKKKVLDDVSQLLKDSKPDTPDKTDKTDPAKARHPRPAPSATPSNVLDDIKRTLDKLPSANKPSSARDPSQTASLGTPTAHAAKMSQKMANDFGQILYDHYSRCWDQSALAKNISYRPRVQVHFRQNGTLVGEPVLANPPGDAAARAMADSALRAIRNCGPLPIPASLMPFYEQWKDPPLLEMVLDGDA